MVRSLIWRTVPAVDPAGQEAADRKTGSLVGDLLGFMLSSAVVRVILP
jgi:hypothetical protein